MLFALDQHDPDHIAVIDDSGQHSYAELCRDARTLGDAAGHRRLGFSLCRNTYASICGYTGALSSGAVPLLLPSELLQERLQTLLDCYQPVWIWVPRARQHEFPDFRQTFALEEYVLLVRDTESPPLADDLALLLTTSGSTGSPKLVRQTYRNIESNTASIVTYLELNSSERPITTLPMHYTYGLSILNTHLSVGATLLMTEESLIQKPFWSFFQKHQPTSLGGVPYTYAMLKRVGFFEMDLPSLHTLTQAGGKLAPEMHRDCAVYAAAHGKRFYVMYGQTEATARMGYLPWQMSLEKCGSMGIAIPGGTFSLIDTDGTRITTPDTVGELIYEGENVTPGYAQCIADLVRDDERKGILHTGDMAACDADGYYRIVGRKKRFLKMYGNRINLDECEQLIKSHFCDLDCACFGEDDLMRIAVTDTAVCNAVQRFCAATLRLSRQSFDVYAVEVIPRGSAGKVLYQQLENAPCR